ncbi:hypothetical protein QCA50_019396 [Cerrena zonata]|uniref:Vacuolar protein sorting-associated protein 9a n=1 Tax=Cerrena zonata TaxID=2478898 RepID=A0AAW0FEU9_9APHY
MESTLVKATDTLQIEDTTIPPNSNELNPWQESSDKPSSSAVPETISTEEKPVAFSKDDLLASELPEFSPPEESKPSSDDEKDPQERKQQILEEFDPLANQEEKAAKEAWESSESHPPPPPSKDPVIPNAHTSTEASTPQRATTTQPEPPRPSSPIPSFPSLAALARTFSIPLGPRTRPRSLDTAAAVPSPATISSFASQQQIPPRTEAPPTSASRNAGPSTPTRSSSRSSRVQSNDREGESLAFDFQKFLDQMKQKNAEPVAKYLRSFLSNFAKRTFTVNDQVKLINDFLNFISQRMRESDVWKNVSETEFDNAMEGMEKLVMNRLYDFTFSPQLIRMVPPRPVTTDDLERDRVLSQRIGLFGWIEPKHLDVPEGEGSEGFLMFAEQELLKINHYKAPRDKLICILNCCKVIFGLIRHLKKEEGADTFVPILIYAVLKANPDHLLSNVEFINRFRNPLKLQSEAGYYLSSLMGAVSFIETMDHTSLSNITQEEFERNVEAAIQSLPSTGTQTPSTEPPSPLITSPSPHPSPHPATQTPLPSTHTGEESAQPLSLPAPSQLSEDAKRFLQKTGDTISKPLSAIGRIFNEVLDGAEESLAGFGPFSAEHGDHPQSPQTPHAPMPGGYSDQLQTPYKPRIRRSPGSSQSSSRYGSPGPGTPEETPSRAPRQGSISGIQGMPGAPYTHQPLAMGPSQSASWLQAPRLQSLVQSERDLQHLQTSQSLGAPGGQGISRTPTPNLDFDLSGLQAEIDRAHESAASASKETLKQIFPTMDGEILEWVLEANEGDLGKSIEALLEMSSGT